MVVASVCLVELSGRVRSATASADTIADSEPDTKADIVPLEVVPDASKPKRPVRKRDTGNAVARMRARNPDLPTREIAQRLGVTDRTVRRHLSTAAS